MKWSTTATTTTTARREEGERNKNKTARKLGKKRPATSRETPWKERNEKFLTAEEEKTSSHKIIE
jgi:hypothetical protein